MAVELARITGQSMTRAITSALYERLARGRPEVPTIESVCDRLEAIYRGVTSET